MRRIIVQWLVSEKLISEEEVRIYDYALLCLRNMLAPYVMVCVLSILLGLSWEGFVLVTPFSIIRKYSGGFHCKKESSCTILSFAVLGGLLLSGIYVDASPLLSIIVTFMVGSIWHFSPIISSNKPVSPEKIHYYRRKTRMIAVITLITYYTLIAINYTVISKWIGLGIIMVAGLQLPCVINRHTMLSKFRESL